LPSNSHPLRGAAGRARFVGVAVIDRCLRAGTPTPPRSDGDGRAFNAGVPQHRGARPARSTISHRHPAPNVRAFAGTARMIQIRPRVGRSGSHEVRSAHFRQDFDRAAKPDARFRDRTGAGTSSSPPIAMSAQSVQAGVVHPPRPRGEVDDRR
jgi:hypothetical protein